MDAGVLCRIAEPIPETACLYIVTLEWRRVQLTCPNFFLEQ